MREVATLPFAPEAEQKDSPRRRSRVLENDALQLLSPDQTAQLLCCSRSTVDRLVSDGILPHVLLRRGRRKRQYAIRRESLRRWIERNETKTKEGNA
jgi:excisionase family DNA binding protein